MSRRGENIYKRKDGRWEGRYIAGRKPDGSAIYRYLYDKTYKEKKRCAAQEKAALKDAPVFDRIRSEIQKDGNIQRDKARYRENIATALRAERDRNNIGGSVSRSYPYASEHTAEV